MNRLLLLLFIIVQTTLSYSQDQFFERLSNAAIGLTKQHVVYDPSYYQIPYPNGDVPLGKGVCTDVVIRAYRKLGIDLQKEVHQDMQINFLKYPNNLGRRTTDENIENLCRQKEVPDRP